MASSEAANPVASPTATATTDAPADAGREASGAAPSEERLTKWLRCECLMNAQYHGAREASLDTVHRWFMLGVVVLGTAAVIKLIPHHSAWIDTALTAFAALLAALDLTFDLSNRARIHSLMKRRYFELLADFDEGKKSLTEARATLHRLSADEEPVYNTLLMLCWNTAQEMVHGDKGGRYDVPRSHRLTKNFLRRSGWQYGMAREPQH